MFIKACNITKTYKSGDIITKALNGVDFSLENGKIGVILGPSGSGKSTLINIIGGIDNCDSGSLIVGKIDITSLSTDELTEYRRQNVGFVFQSYNLIPHLTVIENVEVIQNISKKPIPIDEVLNAVGLADKKHRFPSELSGGEQQRCAIARAIIKNPNLLLCDELTGALDYECAIDVLSLIQKINKNYGTTILIITHNSAIANMANTVYKLRSGEIIDISTNKNPCDAGEITW